MASLALQFSGLRCSPLSSSRFSKPFFTWTLTQKRLLVPLLNSIAIANAQNKERLNHKELFHEAYGRCCTAPMEGVSSTLEDFTTALNDDKDDLVAEVGTKVKGTVFCTDANGAFVEITAKLSAYLPLQEACIHRVKHVEEASIVAGLKEEFLIIGVNEADDSLILSLRAIQYDLAWERCRQLHAEDVIVKGKVVAPDKGGVVAEVEGLRGFVPLSQIPTNSSTEELLEKELPLKLVLVDEEQSRLVLINHKAIASSQAQLQIGSIVTGSVQSLQPYGAFIDIGGITGLLHVSQISHERVTDITTVFQPGDILKVMIESLDRERGRVSLSTKKLETTPGDMVRNPKLVFEKVEETAQTFRGRIARAEAVAHPKRLRFPSESGSTLSRDGMLGPFTSDKPEEGLDLSENSSVEELPRKFVELEEPSRLVLRIRKAIAGSQAQLQIGSVVTGSVESVQPYGAFIDIGGITGLLHVSQISHDHVTDISTVLQPGDILKVMIESLDRERGRVSLSTKKLEPTPGDMVRNPKLVFEKAEETAQTFRERIARAEAMARANMLRFQPESGSTLSRDGIRGPFTSNLPEEGLDLSEVPPEWI
ncbi:hypothetical protein VNO77_05576 [Canavalia gladiata]|uniref:S1 motif domain-containing protein n=1 Tax=Canavalia gladiata TaxID=3824 RepID=A0AAN9N3T2_CANGL